MFIIGKYVLQSVHFVYIISTTLANNQTTLHMKLFDSSIPNSFNPNYLKPGLPSLVISLAAQFEVIVSDKQDSGIHWQM